MGGENFFIRLERKISLMPNIDSPPDPSEVDTWLCESVVKEDGHFLVEFIKSRPAEHELRYMKLRYKYEDFEFAAHYAIEDPWRRRRFLLRRFPEARKRMAKSVGIRIAIGFSILIPFLL
jgi:hypothetical protein